jgi:hypothetical protein
MNNDSTISSSEFRGQVSGNYLLGTICLLITPVFAVIHDNNGRYLAFRLMAITFGITGLISIIIAIRSKLIFNDTELIIQGLWDKRIAYTDIESIASDTVIYGNSHARGPVARYIITAKSGKKIKIVRLAFEKYETWSGKLLAISQFNSVSVEPKTLRQLQSAFKPQ